MQTQTHVFLALALFAKPKHHLNNWAVFAGAMATDLFIYIGFLWFVAGHKQTPQTFFRDTYFAEPMQFWSALSNSLPLYAAMAISAGFIRTKKWGHALLLFALAALSQSAIDLPVHADDAHRHFWPLTDWRFISPISYWDPDHYGRIIGPLDVVLGLICIVILWRRFPLLRVRAVLGIFTAIYLAMLIIMALN